MKQRGKIRGYAKVSKYSHINWVLADQSMVSGVNFLTGILSARYLGVEEYGRFTLSWIAVLFCNSFQLAGIIEPMMSIGPKQPADQAPRYYGAVLAQQVIWSVACFVLLGLGVWLSGWVKPQWRIQDLALPLASALLAWQLQDFLRRYFFVRGRGGLAFLNDAVSYLGQLFLLVVLFRATILNTTMVLWLIAGTSTLAVVVGLGALRGVESPRGVFAEVTVKHWRFSKWLLASALLQWTSGHFFIIGAGGILGVAAVGAMRAAQNIMGVSHIIFQGLENVVPSRASYHLYHGGRTHLLAYLKKVTCWGGASTALVALIAASFPSFWLRLFYGGEYHTYSYVLQWWAVTYLLTFFGLPLRAGLRALEYSKPVFISYCLTTAFTLTTANHLIENFALIGAMLGILGTQIIHCGVLMFSFVKRQAIA